MENALQKELLTKTSEEILTLPDVAVGHFEKSPDASLVIDNEGKILFVNNQAELMFGYHRSELKGKEVEILVPDALKEVHKKHRDGYMDNPHLRQMGMNLDLKAKRKDGREIDVEIHLSPYIPNAILGMIVYVTIRRKG